MRAFFDRVLEPSLNGVFMCRSGCDAHNHAVKPLPHCAPPQCASQQPACLAQAGPTGCAAWRRWPVLVVGLALVLSGVLSVKAGERRDHDRARAAVQAGEVLPLPTLLERLARTHPGQVLDIELEREDGRWIYEVKLLQPSGQLLKLELDAATGAVLQLRRKDEKRDEKRGERKEDRKEDRKSRPAKEAP